MVYSTPTFTVGIEEEYLLVDVETRALASDPPPALFAACQKELGDRMAQEFMRSQIEVNSRPGETVTDVMADIKTLRRVIARIANDFGLAPIAASTHPFSSWREQGHTDKERYHLIARDLQAVVRRLLICGMHIHVGVEDDELRIDLMNQVTYFLPHILMLSTSSPFWQGQETGLMSYRLSVFDELPRTGLPSEFSSWADYHRHVDVLIRARLIEDPTKLWWDVRPSAKYPTLEMRIADVCTRVEDGIAIAALFVCLIRMLWRLKTNNQCWRQYSRMLVTENRWRAQRYGLDEGLVDFGRGKIVPCRDLLEELIVLVGEDAAALGCTAHLDHLLIINDRGTSAHRQLAIFREAQSGGATPSEALRAVVDFLISATVAGD